MANIRLKELLEANVNPKLVARSKESGKLVYFKSPETKAAALKAGSHENPTSKKGEQPKADAKPNDMFGGDYAKDRGGEAPKDNTSIDGQTDDELYDALYDMGYDFGELGSDDFDENGFADAAMNLGYRWDDKNKVWNHRDTMGDETPKSDTPKSDTPKGNLPKKASQLKYKHSESLEKAVNTETGLEGVADIDDNGAIMYNASDGSMPTYTLYMGSNVDYGNPDEFRVSLESTYANDPAELNGKVDKTFKSADEAMAFLVDVAKKYKKELKMDIDDDVNEPSSKLTSMLPKDTADGPKINGKDQTTPNRQFDKKKPFDPKEIEKDVTDMLQSDGYEVKHQWGTNDYFLNISKKDKKGKEIERYTVQKDPKTGMADVWDAIAKTWVVEGEPNIDRLYDTLGQIPYFRED